MPVPLDLLPDLEREIAILQARLPEASERLVRQTCLFIEQVRAGHYRKAARRLGDAGLDAGADGARSPRH